jgi:hypothetical protein
MEERTCSDQRFADQPSASSSAYGAEAPRGGSAPRSTGVPGDLGQELGKSLAAPPEEEPPRALTCSFSRCAGWI